MEGNELRTTKEIIDIYKSVLMAVLQLGNDEADRLINEMRNKKLIATYGAILGDGSVAPEPYVIKDERLNEFLKNEIKKNNEGKHLGDDRYLPALNIKNSSGFPTFIVSAQDRDRFEDLLVKYYVKNNEIVSEIPVDDFEEYGKGEQATVLKGLTEEQYMYIAERTKKNPESYSFSSQRDIDGTYCVTVLARNELTAKRADASFFAGMAVAKTLTPESTISKSLRYDKDLLNEIISYNNENTTMYVTQAKNAGQYLKVSLEKDDQTDTIKRVCRVYSGEKDEPIAVIKTDRNALADEAFIQDVMRYYNKMLDPVKIYDTKISEIDKMITDDMDPDKKIELINMKKYINSLNEQHMSLNTAMKYHAISGDDRDLSSGNLIRPMMSEKDAFREEIFQTYGKYIESQALYTTCKQINEANMNKALNICYKYGLDEQTSEKVLKSMNAKLANNRDYIAILQSNNTLTPELIKEQEKIYKSILVDNIVKETVVPNKNDMYKEIMRDIDNVDFKMGTKAMLNQNLIKINLDAPAMILAKTPQGFDELVSRVRVEELTGVALSATDYAQEQKAAFSEYLAEAQSSVQNIVESPKLTVDLNKSNAIEDAITKNYNEKQSRDYYMLNHNNVKIGNTVILSQTSIVNAQMKGQINDFVDSVPTLKTEERSEDLAKLSDGSIVPEDGSNLGNAALDVSPLTNDDRDYDAELELY